MKNYLCKWIPPRADFLSTLSDEEKAWMSQHGAFLNELLEQDVIIAHGPVMDEAGGYGVALYRIADEEDIAAFTAQDPLIKHGIGHYEHFTMLHISAKR
ncbi:YciI family protein [Pantoea sp. C2G6]|uniref:YciI family protein n=1 Tax=Pantoea sp. C2G6 TaxID=3243084 RepID=UPI003ED8FCDF